MGLDRGLYFNTTCCNEGGKNRLEVVKKIELAGINRCRL